MQQYTVWAKSPSLNQQLRFLVMESKQAPVVVDNEQLANMQANSFAQTLNQKRHMKASDWVGVVKYEDTGVHTLPNYLFHTGK